jgi:hypothetical protein
MREYSNYNAPSNMLVILSREDGEGPHASPWITLVDCVNSKPQVRSFDMCAARDDSAANQNRTFTPPYAARPNAGNPKTSE